MHGFILVRHWAILAIFGCILLPSILCREYEKQADEGEQGDKTNFYEIYEAIDTLTTLTSYSTFYELLGVEPTVTSEELGRAFRRLSFQYHPDKVKEQDEHTERLSKLVQFVGSLMRDQQGRRDYDWVLNEAPAWHRQTYYYMRRFVRTSRLSLLQVGAIVLAFSIGMPLLVQWIGYASEWYLILSSRLAVRRMGDKEVKRMRKRAATGDATFLAMTSTSYHTLFSAERPRPPLPSPLDLWIFRLPLALCKFLWKLVLLVSQNVLRRSAPSVRSVHVPLSPPQSPLSKTAKLN